MHQFSPMVCDMRHVGAFFVGVFCDGCHAAALQHMVSSMSTPHAFLIWTLAPDRVRLHTPTVLLTAAPVDELTAWRLLNPWAAMLPMFWFCDSVSVRAHGGELFADGTVDGPAGVVGFNAAAPRPARVAQCDAVDSPSQITAAVSVAAGIAARAGAGAVVWEVMAEHSDGALAVGVAAVRGRAVAQSTMLPGPLNVAASTRWGVAVKVTVDHEQTRRELDAARTRGTSARALRAE